MTQATLSAPRPTVYQASAADTYEDHLPVIRAVVAAFCRRHAIRDAEEQMSQAHLHFMRAYRRWYDGTSPYYDIATAIRQTIWHGLFDQNRTDTHHKHKQKPVIEHWAEPERIADTRAPGRWYDIFDSLGEDARTVAQLAIDTPKELAAVAEAKGGTPRNLRSSIRGYLADLGWTVERINESFAEVRAVLAEAD